ncbi:hypothetical protein PCASD_20371 [Puccinia coronata f. sp. avenae]|uniref:Uncharacterized protein n=1 Tax=Puccinia coronata f. sp. avenae TaxID=200324 RepID=A0A2N5SQC4_9BASI|nr:hypothetical protein PCASD_20371 [Puccinia coronata f. sp. avenae]
MAESNNKPTTTPSQSTKSTHVAHKLIRQQRDVILENFRDLAVKQYAPGNPSCSIVSVDNHETWKNTLHQLRCNTLPQLRQRINALPQLVNPYELQDDLDGSIHENIIEIQYGLDQNLDQLLSIAAGIKETPTTDDKHLKESKRFTRGRVSYYLQFLCDDLRGIFDSGGDTMLELRKSGRVTSPLPRLSYRVRDIKQYTALATELLDQFLKWITSHEFINIQDNRALELSGYDDKITSLTQFINQSINPPKPEDNGESPGRLSGDLHGIVKQIIESHEYIGASTTRVITQAINCIWGGAPVGREITGMVGGKLRPAGPRPSPGHGPLTATSPVYDQFPPPAIALRVSLLFVTSAQNQRVIEMTESIDSPTSPLTALTPLVPNSIREQRDLIRRNFQCLGDKEFAPQNPSNSILSVDTYQENWKKTLSQLQFTTLPQLRQRINALPKLVNPCELQDDIDGSVHERIIEIQSGLDENLDQILSIVAGIEESLVALPPPPDDKHLRESKRFMRTGASFQLQMLDDELRWIFDSGADTMEELQKSTPATSSTSHPICRSYRVREITMYTATATKSIDELMKWITSHEFINIQERWVLETSDYDSKIARLTQFIHQTINSTEPKDDGQVSDDFANLNKNAIPLAQSLIPIIKLSRLFFTKLAKEGPNKILLKPFTDMNTVQLRTLAESPGDINCDFTRIVSTQFYLFTRSLAPFSRDLE